MDKGLKKGSNVIYNNDLYKVWFKEGSVIQIYKPEAKYPELTMIKLAVKHVRRA